MTPDEMAATTPMPDERLDAIEVKARAAAKHGRDGYFVVDLIEIAELLPTLIAEVRRLRALSTHPAEETNIRATVWQEGWERGFRDTQAAEPDEDGYIVVIPTPNPYLPTPEGSET